jgi:hypothetical protein
VTDYFPCGACAAYVAYEDGCDHWMPARKRSAAGERAARARREQNERVAAVRASR